MGGEETDSMSVTSVDDIVNILRKKYKLSKGAVDKASELIEQYADRSKDFDIIVKNGTVMVIAKKTPTPTPDCL